MLNDKRAPSIRKKAAGPAITKTLGPVSDLERHLPSDWWRSLFNSLYLKTDGDVVENPENTRQDVDLVVRLANLQKEDAILDLCCGQGRHSLELARRGFANVIGVDRSRYLIRQARKRSRAENLPARFHEGDARKFRPRGKAFNTVVLMGNSFGYFEQASDDEAVLKNVARMLTPGGFLLLDLVDGEWMRDHFEPRTWEWIDENHFVCRERALSKDGWRVITREVISHAEKGILADQFYAERLYSREQLIELLHGCGYEGVQFPVVIESDSTRGQDLGMMAHRIIVTSRLQRKTPTRVRPVLFRKVTVMQGDPRRPDTVKLGGQFNEEDFATINRMKEALAQLGDYEFNYYDDHGNFLETMMKNPPEFVLNLCDEGYNNDAFKELHVPAVFEMLGIPYSGAGPQCLGLCYNKGLVSSIAQSIEVPVPSESYVGADDNLATLPSTFPALLKPNFGDSSIGITKNSVVHDADELLAYMKWLRATYGPIPVLIQEFLTGTEYSIGIIGNPGLSYRILAPLEVDYSGLNPGLPRILGYESKWDPQSPYWTQIRYREAQLDEDMRRRLFDYSNVLFERMGCRDYARFDYRADKDGVIKLLEVNPNPGWCWDGKLNIMAGMEGLSYADLLRMIIEAAQERIAAARG